MSNKELKPTTLIFDELAEKVRGLVREELAAGTKLPSIVVLIADMDDLPARQVVESLDCRGDAVGAIAVAKVDVGGRNRRVAGVLTDRMVIASVCACAPNIASAFSLPVPEGQVLTIVMSDGYVEVFHLHMEVGSSLDMAQEDVDAKAKKMFRENKQYLAKMVREEIDAGKISDELLCIIFDLSEETPRKVMAALVPDQDVDAMIPRGRHMIGCFVTDMKCLDRLCEVAPNFKEMVAMQRPSSSIFTMVLFGNNIVQFDLYVVEVDISMGDRKKEDVN